MIEILGFLVGVAGIGAGFWALHSRDSSRVVSSIYGAAPGRSRG
jgi:hypothetical protein